MNTSFLEWAIERDELKEAVKRAYSRTGDVQAEPKQGDIIITNAKGFMKTLITPSRGELKNDGKSSIGMSGISKATISGISRGGQPIVQSTSFNKNPSPIEAENLLDVTPAFDGHQDLETRQSIFIYNRPRGNKSTAQGDVKAMWERWWKQVARPQAATTPEERSTQRVDALLGSTDKLKQKQKDLGDEEKHKQAQTVGLMVNGFREGKPVAGMGPEQVLNIMKGMVGDVHNVRFLRNNGYDDIADTLHDMGLSHVVAGEKEGKPKPVTDPAMGTAAPEDPTRGIDSLLDHPTFNEPHPSDRQPAIQPPPQITNRPGQRLYDRITACYDPGIMSNTRHWKRHNDMKRYAYFAE